MANWITSMFSGKAEEDDVIASRALNITKITGLLVPIGTAALAFLTAGPLNDLRTPETK